MKRKNIFILLAVISFCMAEMSGCSDENNEEKMPVTTAAENNYEARDTDTEVSGEVTKITGNRVTLALGTVSENEKGDFPDGDFPNGSDFPDGGFGADDDFKGNFPQMPEGERPDFGNGEMPMGDFEKGGFGEKSESSMRKDRAGGGRRSSASIEKSGSEAEYIIPAGMPIDGLSGRNSDYSGITVGTILTLTVNEDGIVCAARAE